MSQSNSQRISRQQAVSLQWDLILSWKSRLDTWPYTYGVGTSAGLCSTSGILINQHFRKVLKLGTEFRRASFLPNAILPTIFCGVFHGYFVSTNILIQDFECLPCIETRAIAIQLGCGIVYPMILAPITSFMGSRHFYTYDTPLPWELKKTLQLWWSITKKFQIKLNVLTLVHIAVAALVTHQEVLSLNRINMKLDAMIEEK